jgi:hypothetical protein
MQKTKEIPEKSEKKLLKIPNNSWKIHKNPQMRTIRGQRGHLANLPKFLNRNKFFHHFLILRYTRECSLRVHVYVITMRKFIPTPCEYWFLRKITKTISFCSASSPFWQYNMIFPCVTIFFWFLFYNLNLS